MILLIIKALHTIMSRKNSKSTIRGIDRPLPADMDFAGPRPPDKKLSKKNFTHTTSQGWDNQSSNTLWSKLSGEVLAVDLEAESKRYS